MIPRAIVAHAAPGRVRLRIAEHRRDTAWFDAAARVCAALPAVTHCETNPLTGSLLLEFVGTLAELREALVAVVAFDDNAAAPAPGRDAAYPIMRNGLRDIEAALATLDTQTDTLRRGLSAVLLVLGSVQLLRGRVLAPAASLFWYALNALPPPRAAPVPPAIAAADAPPSAPPHPAPPVVHGHG